MNSITKITKANALKAWDKDNLAREKEIKDHSWAFREFQAQFPKEKMSELTMDKYCVDSGRRDTFSYYMGWYDGFLYFAHIGAPQSNWFGVYKKNGVYTTGAVKKYGDTPEIAFKTIRSEIVKLLDAGEKDDFETIRESLLGDKLRDKILWSYYPDKYLPVFSNEYVNHYLDVLKIPYYGKSSGKYSIDKKEMLKSWKNNNPISAKWSNCSFEFFLDYAFCPGHTHYEIID